jgi:hypothetical protein
MARVPPVLNKLVGKQGENLPEWLEVNKSRPGILLRSMRLGNSSTWSISAALASGPDKPVF